MHGIVTFLLSGMFLHCLPIVLWQGRGEKRVKRNMKLSLQDPCSFTPWTTLSTVIRCLLKIPLSRFWDRLQIYIFSIHFHLVMGSHSQAFSLSFHGISEWSVSSYVIKSSYPHTQEHGEAVACANPKITPSCSCSQAPPWRVNNL